MKDTIEARSRSGVLTAEIRRASESIRTVRDYVVTLPNRRGRQSGASRMGLGAGARPRLDTETQGRCGGAR